jgi:hypothetical protein
VTPAPGFRSRHSSAVAELDAVLSGAPKRPPFDINEVQVSESPDPGFSRLQGRVAL